MKREKQYTNYVLGREKLKTGEVIYRIVKEVESGTEARKMAKLFAEKEPGFAFVAASIWAPIMTREVKSFVYVDPDDPDKVLKSIPEDNTDSGEGDDNSEKEDTDTTPPSIVVPPVQKTEPAKIPAKPEPKMPEPVKPEPVKESVKPEPAKEPAKKQSPASKVKTEKQKEKVEASSEDESFEALFKEGTEPAAFANEGEEPGETLSTGGSIPDLF